MGADRNMVNSAGASLSLCGKDWSWEAPFLRKPKVERLIAGARARVVARAQAGEVSGRPAREVVEPPDYWPGVSLSERTAFLYGGFSFPPGLDVLSTCAAICSWRSTSYASCSFSQRVVASAKSLRARAAAARWNSAVLCSNYCYSRHIPWKCDAQDNRLLRGPVKLKHWLGA